MKALWIVATLALSACGAKGPLTPPSALAVPNASKESITAAREATERALIRPPEAAPERADDLIRRSRERADDRFDLPPPDTR